MKKLLLVIIALLIASPCMAGSFTFRDEFSTDRAAGAVHNSAAEPGVGTRTVTDTENKLSIANGALTFSGGKASLSELDPLIKFPSITRAAGRGLFVKIGSYTSGRINNIYLSTDGSQSGTKVGLRWISPTLYHAKFIDVTNVAIGDTAPQANDVWAIFLRATGNFTFVNNRLMWISASDATATLYPAINNYDGVFSVDAMRVPSTLWLPSPLCSDSFATAFGTSDGAGHAESTGLGSGGAGKVWSNAGTTWSASAGKAINTPTPGEEKLSNGGFADGTGWTPGTGWEIAGGVATKTAGTASYLASDVVATVGKWYKKSADLTRTSGGFQLLAGAAYSTTFTSTATVIDIARAITTGVIQIYTGATGAGTIDNFSAKELTLSELISVVETSTRDVIATVAISTTPAGTPAGLAVGIDSATDPKYGVIAYHDGTNAKLDKLVNGTWTSVISASATFSANAEIRVIRDGTTFRLYYNNAQVGSTSTISDVGDYTLHGLFNTHTTPMDDFTVYARGTGGEYSNLNALMSPPQGGMFLGMGFCF